MGKACSLDFRQRVLEHFDECKNKAKTAKLFKISNKTVYNWSIRREESRLKADKTGPKGPRKFNMKKLVKHLENNRNLTLKELAEEFNVSHVQIWESLRKNGYVYKKNSTLPRKK
jgi:transposase